jgi:hypothetical protein
VHQAAKMAPKYYSTISLGEATHFRVQSRGTYKERVIHGRDLSTMCRICEFSYQNRTRLAEETSEEAEESPRNYKTVKILRESLKDSKPNAGDKTDQERKLPAPAIGDISNKDQRHHFTEGVDRVHEAKKSTFRVVEILSPLR